MIGQADRTHPAAETAGRPASPATPAVGDLAGARGDIYRTFASLFLFPDDARARSIRDALPELQSSRALFRVMVHFGVLDQVCRNVADLRPASLAGLQDAYASLFLTGAGPLACPPCESAYLRQGGLDAGWIGATLEGTYARAGLTAVSDLPPDHAAVELDFLGFLCGQEASSWEAEDTAAPVRLLRRERMFIKQHLGRWFELFAKRLARVDPGGFHATVASSAAAFLAHDLNLIDGLLTYTRGAGELIAR
jgi:TorA maturation chaperone TorD